MNSSTLAELYNATSKHSGYQILPPALEALVEQPVAPAKSRYERERLAFLCEVLAWRGLRVADIGGNTGFFTFELLRLGAASVEYFEGNAAHHAFVVEGARRLGLSDRVRAHAGYVEFTPGSLPDVHCTLLLNVLHHLGDDYGERALARESAKERMLRPLQVLAHTCDLLVFQLGFNWRGDRHQPLFAGGSKLELIEFVQAHTAGDWDVVAIGVAERHHGDVAFRSLNARNCHRDDSLGEFLNRPLFVLRSRHRPLTPGAARAEVHS